MPIFNNNKNNNKRVYLRKKSLRLQNYALAGFFCLIMGVAVNEFLKEDHKREGKEIGKLQFKINEWLTYMKFSQ